ncbi:hypothetical protein [Larkinella sp. C7]|uniref:hypothetical protein n=1 Tax=Larkinella sp. C7 TaxID=2576607 RepID=UPI00111126C3|nr:hypothetical protein [Larkinella sp. C7]
MLSIAQITPYLSLGADQAPSDKLRHAFYSESILLRAHLEKVFDKKYPDYLDINRPKEKKEYKDYRKKIYKNPFKGLKTRVIKTLDYIQQADDFEVAWKSLENVTESLQSYATDSKFSVDGSFQNWFFERVRPRYVNDPNSVMVVLPGQQPASETEYVKPQAFLIGCDKVYAHRKATFAVLESPETTIMADGKKGKIFFFLDHDSYTIARQIANQPTEKGQVAINWEILGVASEIVLDPEGKEVVVQTFRPPLHNCPKMPAVKIGKELVKSNDAGEELYESILTDALPFIELAQGTQNDIQVELNFHVSSEEWRYASKRCPDADSSDPNNRCIDGNKTVRSEDGTAVIGFKTCEKCKGTGSGVSGSGLGYILVTPDTKTSFGDSEKSSNMPIPPGGFIPRSIEPLVKLVEEYKRYKEEAYQEINMQFLMKTPYDESGVSKRFDREELYRELNTQAAHLCDLLAIGFAFIAYLRHKEKAVDQIPAVLVPVRFNLENAELTREELVEAVDKDFDSNLRAPLEKKLIAYQTGEDSDYFKKYELRELLNPYPGKSPEELLFMAASARTLIAPNSPQMQAMLERVWFAINFDGLVNDCLRSDKGFWDLSIEQKYEKLLAENKKLIGDLANPMIGPDGKPVVGPVQLAPPVDITNYSQT